MRDLTQERGEGAGYEATRGFDIILASAQAEWSRVQLQQQLLQQEPFRLQPTNQTNKLTRCPRLGSQRAYRPLDFGQKVKRKASNAGPKSSAYIWVYQP